MSAAVFSDLLVEFQALWDELGDRQFGLIWHNISRPCMSLSGSPLGGRGQITEWLGESKENPPFDLGTREVVARLAMPYDDRLRSFTHGFAVVTLPSHESLNHARDSFLKLCSKAGASLPLVIRNPLAGFVYVLNPDPAAWWFSLLFFLNGESVSFQQGDNVRHHRDIPIYQPLQASVDAIERLRLNSDQPEWPLQDVNSDGDVVELAASSAEPSAVSMKPSGKRGRKAKFSTKDDEKLATDWEAAKASGSTKAEFARGLGIDQEDLEKALARIRARKNRDK